MKKIINDKKLTKLKELKVISGQSLVELLIAMAILVVVISAIILLTFGSQSSTVDAVNANEALQIARTNLEGITADARDNFASIQSSTRTEGIYTIEIIVEDTSLFEKTVTSLVSWETDPLRPQEVELVAIVTNPQEITNLGGDDEGGGLTGDWRNPRTLDSISLTPSGNQGTGLDVVDKIVYLTSTHSSINSDDFWIIDATNGENIVVASSLNLGTKGANKVDVANDYAYVISTSLLTQLYIIDVSDMYAPTITSTLNLPILGLGAEAISVFYYDSKVYVGLKNTADGKEIHVVDVSVPSVPSLVGSYEVGADVNSISVSGSTAYITTSNDSKEVIVLDVSLPNSFIEIETYNAPGSADGRSHFLLGNFLYFGQVSSSNEFRVIDATVPASLSSRDSGDIDGDVIALHSRDYLAFVGNTDVNDDFQVWNIDDPDNISFWSSLNFPNFCSDLDYEDNLVYAAVRSNDALRIITSAP